MNEAEKAIIEALHSEHCSYRSSKKYLKTFPITGPNVICGPGENAGIVDIGDNQAIVFKMESHNHPSFIDPFQGAATGVGGILRDVFTMGARPIALADVLAFGSWDHPKTKFLLDGVVSGISSYGNCIGVPVVTGKTDFHESYNGNNLVNVMAVGLVNKDEIFYSTAKIGDVYYVGAKTGRDGIDGATMSSKEFSDEAEMPVQIGDPFGGKILMEACLELVKTKAVLSMQDMGAAGLTSSSFEMAAKAGLGIYLDLNKVPIREEMTTIEILLSETQERMLMILDPTKKREAIKIFKKWDLNFACIGKTNKTGRFVVNDIIDLPIDIEAPEDNHPFKSTSIPYKRKEKVLFDKRSIWEQYDYGVGGNTLQGPGKDVAIIRINDEKSIVICVGSNSRLCGMNPYVGGKTIVSDVYKKIKDAGADPLAITNCLNFGSPKNPQVMGQFIECVKGIAHACEENEFPVVSGNVSFYNETSGNPILPTPVIGGIGLLTN